MRKHTTNLLISTVFVIECSEGHNKRYLKILVCSEELVEIRSRSTFLSPSTPISFIAHVRLIIMSNFFISNESRKLRNPLLRTHIFRHPIDDYLS